MSQACQLHSNLMGPAREQADQQQAFMLLHAQGLGHAHGFTGPAPAGRCFPRHAFFHNRVQNFCAAGDATGAPRQKASGPRTQATYSLITAAFAHGLLHVAQRLEAGGHQQNAGCIFVQAVHRRGLESRARIMGRKSGSQAVAVAGAWMGGQACGFEKSPNSAFSTDKQGKGGKRSG